MKLIISMYFCLVSIPLLAAPGDSLREEGIQEMMSQLRPAQKVMVGILTTRLREHVSTYLSLMTQIESHTRRLGQNNLTEAQILWREGREAELDEVLSKIHAEVVERYGQTELALLALQTLLTEDFKNNQQAQKHILWIMQIMLEDIKNLLDMDMRNDRAQEVESTIKKFVKYLEKLVLELPADNELAREASRTLNDLFKEDTTQLRELRKFLSVRDTLRNLDDSVDRSIRDIVSIDELRRADPEREIRDMVWLHGMSLHNGSQRRRR